MFCFQCEQTAGGKGCAGKAGVCGKQDHTALLQDELTGALIGLARAAYGKNTGPTVSRAIIEGLFTTVTNVNFSDEAIRQQVSRVRKEINALGGGAEYPMPSLWNDNEDIRSLKSLILFGIRGMAAYAYHALILGFTDNEVNAFFIKALNAIGENLKMEELLPLVTETGRVNLKCMELLDRTNTETYGTPKPVTVPLAIEKGPFIVVSGHDLHDLKQLLDQTEGKGVNIYTHGEMLPAHGYPELKKYTHLKGNFGTAWQSQQKEFDNIPAPVLFTTNCLMPVKDSYADRVFTTALVAFPGLAHIGEDKNFSPVINRALELGGILRTVP
ncbi:hydroxylamine reductase [Brucepastera parasyntrophica]|uniref:hydroxylamine reductase n=1 Tax=Brucepastera parasyntrophica TaxID=2880008 RepID=UPI00210C7191|nr:hydroxylamine reductase [Brucepastera parasyntrophica]